MTLTARSQVLLVAGAAGVAGVAFAVRRKVPASSPASPPSSSYVPAGYSEPAWAEMTQAAIIQAVRDGRLEYRWHDLPGLEGVSVFEDGGKVGGMRVPVSAQTTAAIVEILTSQTGEKVSPTTPLIEDLIYDWADLRVRPVAQKVADVPHSVAAFNSSIEQQIAQQSAGRPGWGLVSCVGKSWVLSSVALEHPGYAINYGFHWPLATRTTDDGPWPSVDGRSKVFQQPGSRHTPDHCDYSQTLRLCRLTGGATLPSHEPLIAKRLWY